ncbi:hypothetical protein BHM03_00021717 [Ensete ventricosum]|nr:hypothetical protein BHM03_00021717 [Ensete ventricosum]
MGGEESDKKQLHRLKQLHLATKSTPPTFPNGNLPASRGFGLLNMLISLSTRSSRTPRHLLESRTRAGIRQRSTRPPPPPPPNLPPHCNSLRAPRHLETALMIALAGPRLAGADRHQIAHEGSDDRIRAHGREANPRIDKRCGKERRTILLPFQCLFAMIDCGHYFLDIFGMRVVGDADRHPARVRFDSRTVGPAGPLSDRGVRILKRVELGH